MGREEHTSARLTRRQMLGAVPVIAACNSGGGSGATATSGTWRHGGTSSAPRLRRLPERRSDAGMLDIQLTPAPATVDIGAARPIATWAYDAAPWADASHRAR